MGSQNYLRLRLGIGRDFPPGAQVAYVLGRWTVQQQSLLPQILDRAKEILLSVVAIGPDRTMNIHNQHNKRGNEQEPSA